MPGRVVIFYSDHCILAQGLALKRWPTGGVGHGDREGYIRSGIVQVTLCFMESCSSERNSHASGPAYAYIVPSYYF